MEANDINGNQIGFATSQTADGKLTGVILDHVMFLPTSWNDNRIVLSALKWNGSDGWTAEASLDYSSNNAELVGKFASGKVDKACFAELAP